MTLTEKKEHAKKMIVQINKILDEMEKEKAPISETSTDKWMTLTRDLQCYTNLLETIKRGQA